jgi:hypothetical protein
MDEARRALSTRIEADPALRSRLTAHRALADAMHEDARSHVIPNEATIGVFATLGMKPPSIPPGSIHSALFSHAATDAAALEELLAVLDTGVPTGGSVNPEVIRIMSTGRAVLGSLTYRRIGIVIATTVLITAAIVLLQQFTEPTQRPHPREEAQSISTAPSHPQPANPSGGTTPNSNSRVSASADGASPSAVTAATTPPGIPTRWAGLVTSRGSSSSASDLHSASQGSLDVHAAPDVIAQPVEFLPSPNCPPASEPAVAQVVELIIPKTRAWPHVLVSIRAMFSRSAPAVDVPSQSGTVIRDFGIGILFSISDGARLGIEGGRESFPQIFGRSEGGVYATYRQNPLETWIAAVYEHGLLQGWGGHVELLVRMEGGAVWSLGPMLRAGVGLDVQLASGIDLLTAAEGSLTSYRFESNWLTTKRYGLTTGLRLTF